MTQIYATFIIGLGCMIAFDAWVDSKFMPEHKPMQMAQAQPEGPLCHQLGLEEPDDAPIKGWRVVK
jgi:hypothetical protein